MSKPIKAVALISGGLDSMLAAKVVMEQGVAVEGINFFTGFCVEGHTHAIRAKHTSRPKRNNALWVAEQLGIKLHIIDVIEEYKKVLLEPKHGYGRYLNPCLDCKIFMVDKALTWSAVKRQGFDFVVRPVGVEVVAALFVAAVVINCGVGVSAPDDVRCFGQIIFVHSL